MEVFFFNLEKNYELKIPSEIWISNSIGSYLYIILFLLCVFFSLKDKQLNKNIFYSLSILLLFSNYIRNVYVIDEVMMGLENPFNFINFGKFSYSPLSMIDGSVDLLFLSILIPFGFSKEILMHANYFFCFMIAMLSFLFVIKIFNEYEKKIVNIFIIILASSQFFVQIWSPGFPSTFVILFIIISIYFLKTNQNDNLSKLCIFFPLIRPDAILFSGAFFFTLLINEKKLRIKEYFFTFIALLFYFLIVKLLYGHFKPTPMEFKSYGLNSSFIYEILPLKLPLILNTFYKIILFSFLPILSIYLFKIDELKKFQLLLFPFSLIVLFYTTFSMGTHWGGRYLRFYEIYLFILYSLIVLEILDKNSEIFFKTRQNNSFKINFNTIVDKKYFIISILIIFQIFQTSNYIQFDNWKNRNIKNMDGNAVSGQILDKILPKNWTISTTELNYFGYFIDDREIVDLAGYTNKNIANSNIFNSKGIKIDPKFFLKEKTDIYWNRALNENYPKNHLWINTNETLIESTYQNIEEFMTFDNTSTSEFVVGDIEKILKKYDIFLIKVNKWTIVTLVNRKKTIEFIDILKNSGTIIKQKKFDFDNFKNFHKVESIKLIQF